MDHESGAYSRRRALKAAARAGAVALAGPIIAPSSALGRGGATPPSDRVTVVGIGVGRRGERTLQAFLAQKDVQVLAVCDVRAERRDAIKSKVDQHYGNSDCARYADLREALRRRDIDVALIAAGDRWHALMSVLAARSGKDVYCESPCSMTIGESRALAAAFQRTGRVYQAGAQRRNGSNFNYAVQMARRGELGKLHTLHANVGPGDRRPPRTSHDWLPAEPASPETLQDWDRWLGPSPWRPYNSAYLHGKWRGCSDFHGGGILEWGAHTVDLCQWVADADESAPTAYTPQEGPGPTPYAVECAYANGLKLVMRDHGFLGLGDCAVRFEGESGWVETADSGRVRCSLPGRGRAFDNAAETTTYHVRDFLDCAKAGMQPRANALVACQTNIACHAAAIAFQLGRTLRFDPAVDQFLDDDEANRMRSRAMREPWRLG